MLLIKCRAILRILAADKGSTHTQVFYKSAEDKFELSDDVNYDSEGSSEAKRRRKESEFYLHIY